MALSKKTRFDVFKRDSFTCAYCGQKTPDVILEVDHIVPTSKGGTDIIENLITSCFDCNRGKSNRSLNELPRSNNFDDLKEKYDQLKEFYNYQKKIATLKESVVDDISSYWTDLWNGETELTPRGKSTIKTFLKDFQAEEIKECMDIAVGRINNCSDAFKYMCGIIHNKKRARMDEIIDGITEALKK
jgi:hypothetical protein